MISFPTPSRRLALPAAIALAFAVSSAPAAPRAPNAYAVHNLVSDGGFNEFNLIVCRNVMIYFDRGLQDKVHSLFYESLVRFGILGLGHKESIRFTGHAEDYVELDAHEKLYRRVS